MTTPDPTPPTVTEAAVAAEQQRPRAASVLTPHPAALPAGAAMTLPSRRARISVHRAGWDDDADPLGHPQPRPANLVDTSVWECKPTP